MSWRAKRQTRQPARLARTGLLLLASSGLWTCAMGGDPLPAADSPRVEQAPLLVTRGALEDRMVLTGELEAIASESLIVPRTPNWTLSISWLADEGAVVNKGERVVEFDTSTLTSNLEERRANVQRAENELQSERARAAGALADKTIAAQRVRADLAKARVEADVPTDLVARRDYQKKQLDLEQRRDAVAHAEQDLAVQQQTNQLDLRVKEVALQRAERDYQSLTRQLADLTLLAPRDGIVQLAVN